MRSPPATPSAPLGSDPVPRVGTARQLRRHGVRPDRRLGQHFLLDENLVDLSLRQAEVGPGDVVLEIGAGTGVLTAALARAARVVHAVEVDRRLERALTEALAGAGDVRVIWGDAMDVDWGALDPPPTALVANLPYDIATPVVLESLWRLPSVERWSVLAQREVVDRWLATPGTAAYGAASVLLQLGSEATFRRAVGPEVFAPPPRVESAMVALRRRGQPPSPEVRDLVRAAFATRRKTVANALAARGADKSAVEAALTAAGRDPSARAGDLAPSDFPALTGALRWTS